MDKRILVLGGTSIVSAAVGVAVGYSIATKRMASEFEKRYQAAKTALDMHFKMKYKVEEFATAKDAAQTLGRDVEQETRDKADAALALYQTSEVSTDTLVRIVKGLKDLEGPKPKKYAADAMVEYSNGAQAADNTLLGLHDDDDEDPLSMHYEGNIFDENEAPETPYEELIRLRNTDEPYILSKDEFFENESGYDQSTCTYFEEDGILIDEQERIIEKVDSVVGLSNMDRFGMGSGQAHVVYIRNERLRGEYEVCRSTGSYAKEIAGFRDDVPIRRRPVRRSADE